MTRTKKGVGPQPIPLKGAMFVEGEGQDSLALKMLIDQMTAYQQQTMLGIQAMQAALMAQTEQVKALQTEIAAVKSDAAEALAETRMKMQQLMERKPTDPATLQKMVADAKEQAIRQMHEANTRFTNDLATMPRGNLDARDVPYTGEQIRLIINGVPQLITLGKVNPNVPQAFIDHYEKRKDERRWASGVDAAFQMRDKAGDFMGAGHYENVLTNAGVEASGISNVE